MTYFRCSKALNRMQRTTLIWSKPDLRDKMHRSLRRSWLALRTQGAPCSSRNSSCWKTRLSFFRSRVRQLISIKLLLKCSLAKQDLSAPKNNKRLNSFGRPTSWAEKGTQRYRLKICKLRKRYLNWEGSNRHLSWELTKLMDCFSP
jgi:hypothetical protein